MKRLGLALAFLAVFNFSCLAAALTPAVNAPMLSMAGGTDTSTIWVPTATVLINTAAETSCISGTGQGPGQTITPSTVPVAPYVGNTFLLQCTGVFTTPAVNTATITPRIKWGSVTVAGGTASSGLAASSSNTLQFTLTGMCTLITISASANSSTVMCSGSFTYGQGITGSSVVSTNFQSTSPVSVDTVSAFKPDLTMQWSSVGGTPAQSATSLMGLVQILF